MNHQLLEKLSNADAIASNESQVRDILYKELQSYCDEITCDNLGSIIFTKYGKKDGPKIMLCAHMDEVGFIVRSISDLGHIMVMPIGAVKALGQFMQEVRITTQKQEQIYGILQGSYKDQKATNVYVDIGVTSKQEVCDLGIEVGDMVTFASKYRKLSHNNCIMGKAFDDRLGCYVLAEVLKKLKDIDHPNTVCIVATSSEEVGIRGAKTATYKIQPDIVLPIDVACFQDEFIKNHTNQRQIGKGMMQTNFDRTLVPNKTLVQYVRSIAKGLNKNLQLDMFTTGGTDGGEAHKVYEGIPTVVSCIPVRYGHCSYSIANINDIEDSIDIFVEMIKQLDNDVYRSCINFLGGK